MRKSISLAVACVIAACLAPAAATASDNPTDTPPVPRWIQFKGAVPKHGTHKKADVIGITFFLYADRESGAPLWLETQNVLLQEDLSYQVLLGSTKAEGIPLEVFASGRSRWLGISIENGPEGERIPIASVPYAVRAYEAETLAGRRIDEFLLIDQDSRAEHSTLETLLEEPTASFAAAAGKGGNTSQSGDLKCSSEPGPPASNVLRIYCLNSDNRLFLKDSKNTVLGPLAAVNREQHWSARQNFTNAGSVRFADQFPGNDGGESIQAAIDDIPRAEGGIVFLPSGVYSISAPIDLKTGVCLVGANQGDGFSSVTKGALLEPTAGFSGSAVIRMTAGAAGVSVLRGACVRDLAFNMANVRDVFAIEARGLSNSQGIKNVVIYDASGTVLLFDKSDTLSTQATEHIQVENVFIYAQDRTGTPPVVIRHMLDSAFRNLMVGSNGSPAGIGSVGILLEGAAGAAGPERILFEKVSVAGWDVGVDLATSDIAVTAPRSIRFEYASFENNTTNLRADSGTGTFPAFLVLFWNNTVAPNTTKYDIGRASQVFIWDDGAGGGANKILLGSNSTDSMVFTPRTQDVMNSGSRNVVWGLGAGAELVINTTERDLRLSGGLQVGEGSHSPGQPRLFSTQSSGLVIAGTAGVNSDFAFTNSKGFNVFDNPSNSNDLRAFGSFLPMTSGQGLGSENARWSAFLQNLNVLGPVDSNIGFRVASNAPAGTFLRGNGTDFVAGRIKPEDVEADSISSRELAAPNKSGQFEYVFFAPSVALTDNTHVPGVYANRARAITLKEVYCEVHKESAVINLLLNGGISGQILQSNLVCLPQGSASTSLVPGANSIAIGEKIDHMTVSVGTGVQRLSVVVSYTVD